jgi:catechol-2,3-dioxygenase
MHTTHPTIEEPKNRSVIDHIAIVVDDIDASVDWYESRFDCDVRWHDASWAYLQFANCGLALVVDGSHPSHFAVQVTGLSRFGQPLSHRDGTRFIYVNDHDGNVVEMLDRSAVSEASQ